MSHTSDYRPGRLGHVHDGDNFFGDSPDDVHVFTGTVYISGAIVITSGGVSPGPHAPTHEHSGGDEIDGDHLDIDFIPINYLPDTSISEATTTQHLAAHLAGIDNELSKSVEVSCDLTGTLPCVTVVGLQRTPISNVSASNNEVLTYNSASGEWEPASFAPGTVFGTQYRMLETGSIFSTTNTSFQNAAKYPTGPVPAGLYRILYMYCWSHDSTNNDIEVEVLLDSSTKLVQPNHRQEPKDSSSNPNPGGTDQRHYVTGMATASLGSGSHFVEINVRTTKAGKESSIHSSKFEFFRIN